MTDDDEIVGLTDGNQDKNKAIVIDDTIEAENPKDLLRVLLDEGIHACNFTIANDEVAKMADSLSSFLHRCGYRRVKATSSTCSDRNDLEE